MNIAQQIFIKSVKDIKVYENNARINDHVVEALKNSITKFGFNSPIILSEKDVIICGHTRLKAALELGITHVPCVYAEGLTDEEINAYRLADNKISELAIWDMGKLDEELAKINAGNHINMEDFGFNPIVAPIKDPVVGGIEPEETEEEEQYNNDEEPHKPRLHKCPCCGEVFED